MHETQGETGNQIAGPSQTSYITRYMRQASQTSPSLTMGTCVPQGQYLIDDNVKDLREVSNWGCQMRDLCQARRLHKAEEVLSYSLPLSPVQFPSA